MKRSLNLYTEGESSSPPGGAASQWPRMTATDEFIAENRLSLARDVKIEETEVKTTLVETAQDFLDYMQLAWEKALNQMGIGALQSIDTLGALLKRLSREDLHDLIHCKDLYAPYGSPALIRVCSEMGIRYPKCLLSFSRYSEPWVPMNDPRHSGLELVEEWDLRNVVTLGTLIPATNLTLSNNARTNSVISIETGSQVFACVSFNGSRGYSWCPTNAQSPWSWRCQGCSKCVIRGTVRELRDFAQTGTMHVELLHGCRKTVTAQEVKDFILSNDILDEHVTDVNNQGTLFAIVHGDLRVHVRKMLTFTMQ